LILEFVFGVGRFPVVPFPVEREGESPAGRAQEVVDGQEGYDEEDVGPGVEEHLGSAFGA